MFCHFWQKFENSKWPPFLGREKFFGKLQRLHSLDTLWVENFDEIALSRTVKEIEANLCFASFGKNSKIQNGRHFWGGENFLKTRLGQLGANISPDRSSLTPQVLIGNFLKHNYPLLYELQHINLLCLYLPRKMVYPQTPNT